MTIARLRHIKALGRSARSVVAVWGAMLYWLVWVVVLLAALVNPPRG